jgi:hypothetical protein
MSCGLIDSKPVAVGSKGSARDNTDIQGDTDTNGARRGGGDRLRAWAHCALR